MADRSTDGDRDAPKPDRDDKSSIDVLEHIGGGVQIEQVIGSSTAPNSRPPFHKRRRHVRSS